MKLCNRCGENHLHCNCSFRWGRLALLLLTLFLLTGCDDGVPIEKNYEFLKTFPASVQIAFIYRDVAMCAVGAVTILAIGQVIKYSVEVENKKP
jgi:hypothetical protein